MGQTWCAKLGPNVDKNAFALNAEHFSARVGLIVGILGKAWYDLLEVRVFSAKMKLHEFISGSVALLQ